MNEEKEGWWDRHSWPGPDQWYEGPLEVFETGEERFKKAQATTCLLYTSPSPRD